jgi:hypothetical protein
MRPPKCRQAADLRKRGCPRQDSNLRHTVRKPLQPGFGPNRLPAETPRFPRSAAVFEVRADSVCLPLLRPGLDATVTLRAWRGGTAARRARLEHRLVRADRGAEHVPARPRPQGEQGLSTAARGKIAVPRSTVANLSPTMRKRGAT